MKQVSVSHHTTGEVWFVASATGDSDHGSLKGLLHTHTSLDRLRDALDKDATKPFGERFRRIDDHWYLYLTQD
jgi:hypothetical protein